MDLLHRFAAYAVDFEKTFEDDDWTRLADYFTEDAVSPLITIPSLDPEPRVGPYSEAAGPVTAR